jgi:hypothetical protein
MSSRERIATWPSDRANRQTNRPTEILSGTRVLSLAEVDQWQTLSFDCNGAGRNLDLPDEQHCNGVYLYVTNATAATHALTVRNDVGGTIVAIPAAATFRAARVWCDGTAWRSLLGA